MKSSSKIVGLVWFYLQLQNITKALVQEEDSPSSDTNALQSESTPTVSYGYDVSFPMLGKIPKASTNYAWLPHNADPENNPTPEEYQDMPIQPLGDRQAFYEEYIQGCRDYWKEDGEGHLCDEYEIERLDHNTDQIPSMVNYTDVGYKKIRAPEHVFELLLQFWEKNKDKEVDEEWVPGNIFVNYWKSPCKMVNVANNSYEGGGDELLDELWGASVDTISEWTGQNLVPSSLYGIRVYKEGAVLSSHVDRLPLVSSAIINVAQDPDGEPWPLEVIGHDGVARNVTVRNISKCHYDDL
jgi:HRD ubiquitin ligase complex, ER membrane component